MTVLFIGVLTSSVEKFSPPILVVASTFYHCLAGIIDEMEGFSISGWDDENVLNTYILEKKEANRIYMRNSGEKEETSSEYTRMGETGRSGSSRGGGSTLTSPPPRILWPSGDDVIADEQKAALVCRGPCPMGPHDGYKDYQLRKLPRFLWTQKSIMKRALLIRDILDGGFDMKIFAHDGRHAGHVVFSDSSDCILEKYLASRQTTFTTP